MGVSGVAAASLDQVSRSLVPGVGAGAAVVMFRADGSLRHLSVAHVDRERELRVRRAAQTLARDRTRTFDELLGRRRTVFLTGSPDEDPSIQRLLRAAAAGAAAFVPISQPGFLVALSAGARRFDAGARARLEYARGRIDAVLDARLPTSSDGQSLADFHHDLAQPLAAARLQLAAVPSPSVGCAELRQRIAHAARCLDEMHALLQAARSREACDRGRACSASAVAADVVTVHAPLAQSEDVQLVSSLRDEDATVAVGPVELYRVLSNLVGNAIRHSRPGGRVCVSTSANAHAVSFRVRDSGEGISPVYLEKIFDPEWVAQSSIRRGSGRGLAIVKALVERAGGRVEALSHPGDGVTFHFTLPRSR